MPRPQPPQASPYAPHFAPANGLAHPLSIIATDLQWPPKERPPHLSSTALYKAIQNAKTLYVQNSLASWTHNRTLEPEKPDDTENYSHYLNVTPTRFASLLQAIKRILNHKLKVLDFGCGNARALIDIHDCRNAVREAIGLTLPRNPNEPPLVISQTLVMYFLDALKLQPAQRFDVVINVFGAADYSPLNQVWYHDREIEIIKTFGHLQAINLLKVGGYLATNAQPNSHAINVLLEIGLLETDPRLNKFGRNDTPPHFYRLTRRPTVEDIKILLALDAENTYHIELDRVQ